MTGVLSCWGGVQKGRQNEYFPKHWFWGRPFCTLPRFNHGDRHCEDDNCPESLLIKILYPGTGQLEDSLSRHSGWQSHNRQEKFWIADLFIRKQYRATESFLFLFSPLRSGDSSPLLPYTSVTWFGMTRDFETRGKRGRAAKRLVVRAK